MMLGNYTAQARVSADAPKVTSGSSASRMQNPPMSSPTSYARLYARLGQELVVDDIPEIAFCRIA
jgi:hypothetical protein